MTETELRQKVVSTALAWLGTREYSAKHQEMLGIYNSQSPLPRGTRMLASWPWCAAFVSTVSLQCGLRDVMPTECGCPGMVRLYQEIGRWAEDDAYIPSPGDVIFYDWQDTGYGDNAGQPDHVGIVTGFADDGRVLMCHCMRGGVTVSYAEDFGMDNYYRPAAYYAAYETPETLPEISVTEYAGSEDGAVYLVKVAAEPGTRCRWTLDGAEMLYSETYGAWCALTTANDAAARVSRVRCSGGSDTVCYDGDVNGSGVTEINDAQRIYSISCGQQRFETKNAEAWLKADLNGDGRITAEDASEILRLI